MSDIAVEIKNVKKTFHLPNSNYDSLKQRIIEVFKKKDKGYGKYKALKGVNLTIRKGEFIGILGRNGAGKSTLLKIIAEIYQPSKGTIKVNGKLVPFIELGVGFNKNLTGRDNVYLNGAMLGFSRSEIDEMYDSIVDFAELHNFMDQKLKNYSSGMKVRLAFSVAIKADADILLLDEVLAVGDVAFKRKCYDYFNTLKSNKKTIIFVTHNMSAARDYCDRAVLLEDGKVTFDGSPEDAADKYFQMFNTSEKAAVKEKKVIFEDVAVEVVGEKIKFTVKVANTTSEKIANVLVRIAVKKQNGRVVAGFDNHNIGKPFEIDFSEKEAKTFVFETPNIIGNGNYTVNAALLAGSSDSYIDEDESETAKTAVYDSRPNIAHFSIKNVDSNAPVLLPAVVADGGKVKA